MSCSSRSGVAYWLCPPFASLLPNTPCTEYRRTARSDTVGILSMVLCKCSESTRPTSRSPSGELPGCTRWSGPMWSWGWVKARSKRSTRSWLLWRFYCTGRGKSLKRWKFACHSANTIPIPCTSSRHCPPNCPQRTSASRFARNSQSDPWPRSGTRTYHDLTAKIPHKVSV